jgi:hypothetical protein
MEQELLFCHICKDYYEVKYNGGNITSEEKCSCKRKQERINGMKPLDYALLKLKEVLNEKHQSSISKISISTKTSKQRF